MFGQPVIKPSVESPPKRTPDAGPSLRQFRAAFIMEATKNGVPAKLAVDQAKTAEQYVFGSIASADLAKWVARMDEAFEALEANGFYRGSAVHRALAEMRSTIQVLAAAHGA